MGLTAKRVVIIALCAFIFASAQSVVTQAPASQKASANTDWQTYELGKGSFSVFLPGNPTETVQRANDADIYIYSVATNWGILVANYSLLSEAAEKWPEDRSVAFYEGFWEGLASTINGQLKEANSADQLKLEEHHKATFAAHDGFEFIFSLGQNRGRLLITRVGRRAYSGMILGSQESLSEYQDKFLGTFKIIQPDSTNQKP
jgi:hypothetical protein